MKETKDIIRSVAVLTLICIVISGALAVVNGFTAPVSAANAAIREDEARRLIIPDAVSFEKLENDEFSENIIAAYAGIGENGEISGYVFTVTGTGFGGRISVICGIDAEGRLIRTQALDIFGETKTLGGKVVNPEYADQYIGKDSGLSGVNAISGATITSDAYRRCVEEAFAAFERIGEVA